MGIWQRIYTSNALEFLTADFGPHPHPLKFTKSIFCAFPKEERIH